MNNSVLLGTASYDHTIKIWDATSGNCINTISYNESVIFFFKLKQVNSIQLSYNQSILVAACHNVGKVIGLLENKHKILTSLEGHTNNITSIGLPKEQKWVFTGRFK
jgi:G protein beta subunit-like protein